MQHSTRLWSLIHFAVKAARTAPQPEVAQTVLSMRDGELLCGRGDTIHLNRRECEIIQILMPHFGHFVSWQEIARQLFAVTDETMNEAAMIRTYISRFHRKIDRKCSFGIEGKPGYGYRLFGQLLIDPPAAGASQCS